MEDAIPELVREKNVEIKETKTTEIQKQIEKERETESANCHVDPLFLNEPVSVVYVDWNPAWNVL